MPRKSPYIIELSNQERKILEAQAHWYTLLYPDVVRAKIVLMAAEGLDHHKIAAHLDTRREAVSKWPRRATPIFGDLALLLTIRRPHYSDTESFIQ